jgi:hypothetical protein
VTVGYTPGYHGTCVTRGSGLVVVYGTGYRYHPWVRSVWFGPPVTYGTGVSITYTPWTGWTVGFGFGWYWGPASVTCSWGWGPHPWWGPIGWGHYYPYPYWRPPYGGVAWGPRGGAAWGVGGWAAASRNIYHRWPGGAAVTRGSRGFNAWTGNRWANQVGMSYNSRTGNLAAGQRAAVHNVYTGDYAHGRRGSVTNVDTGRTVTGGRVTGGNAYTGDRGSAAWVRGEQGGVARVGDDIYAGRDGSVYRRGDGGWQQNSGKGWSSVPPQHKASQHGATAAQGAARHKPGSTGWAAPKASTSTVSTLDRQRSARSAGQQRTSNFRSGGYRRAGGGRRR